MIHKAKSKNVKIQIDETFSCVRYDKCPADYKKCSPTSCMAHELAALGYDTWAAFDLSSHYKKLQYQKDNGLEYNKNLYRLIENSI